VPPPHDAAPAGPPESMTGSSPLNRSEALIRSKDWKVRTFTICQPTQNVPGRDNVREQVAYETSRAKRREEQ